SQRHFVFLRTSDSAEDLLRLTNPALINIRRTLPLKARRSHSPESLHDGCAVSTIRIRHPLMVCCRHCHPFSQLCLQVRLSLGLQLKGLHQSGKRLKESPKFRWWRQISLTSPRDIPISLPSSH